MLSLSTRIALAEQSRPVDWPDSSQRLLELNDPCDARAAMHTGASSVSNAATPTQAQGLLTGA
eukprot:370208-Pleurochrysis_carterae.AAC.1